MNREEVESIGFRETRSCGGINPNERDRIAVETKLADLEPIASCAESVDEVSTDPSNHSARDEPGGEVFGPPRWLFNKQVIRQLLRDREAVHQAYAARIVQVSVERKAERKRSAALAYVEAIAERDPAKAEELRLGIGTATLNTRVGNYNAQRAHRAKKLATDPDGYRRYKADRQAALRRKRTGAIAAEEPRATGLADDGPRPRVRIDVASLKEQLTAETLRLAKWLKIEGSKQRQLRSRKAELIRGRFVVLQHRVENGRDPTPAEFARRMASLLGTPVPTGSGPGRRLELLRQLEAPGGPFAEEINDKGGAAE